MVTSIRKAAAILPRVATRFEHPHSGGALRRTGESVVEAFRKFLFDPHTEMIDFVVRAFGASPNAQSAFTTEWHYMRGLADGLGLDLV
jgi:hypothetical protein